MRALAHPTRLQIRELLDECGPLTATELAHRTGQSPANCSFHLRTLAKYGFIEEASGGRGRTRPWRIRAQHEEHSSARKPSQGDRIYGSKVTLDLTPELSGMLNRIAQRRGLGIEQALAELVIEEARRIPEIQDWTYYGVLADPGYGVDTRLARVLVETHAGDTSHHEHASVVFAMTARTDSEFKWDSHGSVSSRAAASILAHALALGDPDRCGIGLSSSAPDGALVTLREAFRADFLSQLPSQWRLRRSVIVRWTRDWKAHYHDEESPLQSQRTTTRDRGCPEPS